MLTVIFNGNPDLGATVTDFMAILQSIYYSMFEKLSNVSDETSKKLLSSLLEIIDNQKVPK